MKHIPKLTFSLFFSLVILTVGCAPITPSSPPSEQDSRKLQVITTLFPTYDFARTLLGDKGDVTLLLPPGIEAHAFEPTPQDIVRISKADVFIYTGEAMEPWVHDILKTIDNKNLKVIDASTGIELMEGHHHEEGEEAHEEGDSDHEASDTHEEEDADHDHAGADPHIWLDPVLAAQMTDTIANGLIEVAPDWGKDITVRKDALKADLEELNQSYLSAVEKSSTKEIIYGGHFAFGYLAKRYGLEHISPYDGFSPNAEPTPASIVQLTEALKTSGSKVIFYQELIDPRIARVIADETGAEMLMLHGAHNVSKEDFDKGITYITIMKQNLENLKKGLGYRE